jgi:cytochrome c-type biogenesis protein CcmH
MTTFWIAFAALILLALILVWRHFLISDVNNDAHKQQLSKQQNVRSETNITLYHEHLAELEKDYAEGGIDQESYQELKVELDQTLLQDMDGQGANETKDPDLSKTKTSKLWPVAVSIFIIGFACFFYFKHGAYQQVATMPTEPISQQQAHAGSQAEQIIAQLQQLRNEVEQNPNNSDAWFMMAQILSEIGEYDAAIIALDKTLALEGEPAAVLAVKAQTVYYKNRQKITPEVQAIIDKALSKDPQEPAVLVLLGMDSFFNDNFAKAISYWQEVIDSKREGVNIAALTEAINEAQQQLEKGTNNEQATGPKLNLAISLSAEVSASLAEDKVIFIYATPANGSRMPVAAVKLMASDLPVQVVLSDAQAMSAQANLSATPKVDIQAVLSQEGKPGVAAGDYVVKAVNISNQHQDVINLVIGELVE